MSDQWVKPFAVNQVCYCKESKEFVRISNGTCTLDHSTPEAFKASHTHADGSRGCLYAPSEAVALRVVGIAGKGDPVIAFTYRKVRPEDLEPAAPDSMIDTGNIRRSRFIGRV